MSQEKITEIEKDVAVMKATINPLITQMKDNTKALNKLTSQIEMQISMYGDIKEDVSDLKERTKDLERVNLLRQRGDEFKTWLTRLFIAGCVSALLGFLWYAIDVIQAHPHP